MGGWLWQQALSAARDIVEGALGEMLGWLMVMGVLALLTVPVLYLMLKKMGWRGAHRNPYSATRTSITVTLGQRQLPEGTVQQMLSDPRAKVQTIRLDGSDPQTRASCTRSRNCWIPGIRTCRRSWRKLSSRMPRHKVVSHRCPQRRPHPPSSAGRRARRRPGARKHPRHRHRPPKVAWRIGTGTG